MGSQLLNFQKMKRSILFPLILVTRLVGFSQTDKVEGNELSLNLPVLYNKTTITNVYGPTRQISGTGISSGINISYKRFISNGIYVKIGLGYFAQNFSLSRPYEDSDFTLVLYTTRKYTYHCLERLIGIGYKSVIGGKYFFDVSANYHQLRTFKQKYFSRDDLNITETNYRYQFASILSIAPSFQRIISDRVKFSTGIVIPVITSWKKDVRFAENRNDTYRPSFHLGIQMGIHYNF
jgi:hypothetical protein